MYELEGNTWHPSGSDYVGMNESWHAMCHMAGQTRFDLHSKW